MLGVSPGGADEATALARTDAASLQRIARTLVARFVREFSSPATLLQAQSCNIVDEASDRSDMCGETSDRGVGTVMCLSELYVLGIRRTIRE